MSENKQVALITGANKGIGFETARQLGKLGITVIVGSRDANRGEAAAAKLRAEGIDAQPLKLDVTRRKTAMRPSNFIQEKFGKLDILVNNAGIAEEGGWGKNTTSSTSAETLEKTFETNLFAPVALTQALLPLIRKSSCRTHRQSLQHSGFKHSAQRSKVSHLQQQGLCLRRVQVGSECLHDSSGA